MSALSICLLLLGSVLLVTAELDCSNQHTDGCSIPFNLPWFYKDEFTPECHKHDICYACGADYGFTRDDCNERFKVNLDRRCESLNKGDDWLNNLHCKARVNEYTAAAKTGGILRYTSKDNVPSWCATSMVRMCL